MATDRVPFYHGFLHFCARWLFTVYHDIRVEGAKHVPASGPAIIAANHPTYLDPAFLMVGLSRPVRFMAWEKPFRIPLLGLLMRSYGAIPLNKKKPGRASFEAAVKVLRQGEIFGIFPEGGRTKTLAPMNPLKSGVARLAMITGAPIVPATVIGGLRVWRRGELFWKPGPITIVFHPPMRVQAASRLLWRRDKSLERRVIEQLIETIHRRLLPSLRRDRRLERLMKAPPQPPSLFVEGIPFIFLLLSFLLAPRGLWEARAGPAVHWISGYGLALVAELALEARGFWVKWLRQLLPWIMLSTLLHRKSGIPLGVWIAACLPAAAVLLWVQYFRFPIYRRVRTPLLVAGFGLWLLKILRAG
ncbi:MAG: 1-acyl-sn-glycerol-3-phosphate acyltransferase [Elusimicrobia bacterium]|nr:1-acyl-sn-glycerol-3-phosphate acyltransferase [Elusimicrobiota bacterium]